jgi:hypothetical protein
MTLETPKEKQIYGFAMVDCQRAQKLILAPASTPKGKSFLPWSSKEALAAVWGIYISLRDLNGISGYPIISGWWFFATPLKNMSASVGMMTFPTEWKNKKCSKPPTSYHLHSSMPVQNSEQI